MKPKSILRNFLLTAGSSLLAISSASAGQIWDGTGANTNWDTLANWDGDTLPDFASAITFAGTTRPTNVNNLAADTTIGGINFTNTSGTFSISGAKITLGGNIVTTAAGAAMTDAISLAMILDGNRTITTNTNHNLTLSGIISGTGTHSLIKDGAGTITLSGANTYSGGFTLNGGTVNAIGTGTYAGFGSGTFTATGGNLAFTGDTSSTINNNLNWGGSLIFQRSGGSANGIPTFNGTLTLSSNLALSLGAGTTRATGIFTNNISGDFSLTASSDGASAGTSVLTLSGDNTFSGGG
jgi:autotransporter-associated beta strand protein